MVARELGTEAQIPVLAVGDEVLVEEPDVVEHLSAVQGSRSARREDVGGVIELAAVTLPVAEAVGEPAQS